MFLRAMCSQFLLLTQFSSVSIKNPLCAKVLSFKNVYTPQGNVSTHDASDAILSSVLIETPYLEIYFHLSIFMLLRAMCS